MNDKKILFFFLLLLLVPGILLLRKMKIVKGEHDGEGWHVEIGKRTHAHPINEWRQLFQIRRCNWYSFTPIYIYGEIDAMTNSLELTITMLGLGFYARYDYDFEHSMIKGIADEAYMNHLLVNNENNENNENKEECE